MIRLSRRIGAVQPAIVPIVSRWIDETPGTISLGQGVVAYGPPPPVLEAVSALGREAEGHRYGPVEGDPELIDALEAKLARENDTRVRPDRRVIVTAGANQAFVNAVLAIADPGDEFIFPTPFYFNHEMAVVMAGCTPMAVATEDDYQLYVDAIEAAITLRTRAVVTVSPNNPTGAVYAEADLREVNALCARRGLFHIHDEAYEYFTYADARHFSPGSIDGSEPHTISLYSLSKAYGMAGWRVGYMVVPEALVDAVTKIQDTLLVCPPTVSQRAGLAAVIVGRTYARWHRPGLDARRKLMYRALSVPTVPCDVPAAQGAFYYFLRMRSRLDSLTLAERLVREHQVAAIPGSAFGASGCTIRVSYGALDEATAAEGAARLVRGLQALVDA